MGHVVNLMAIKMPVIRVTSSVARGMRCVCSMADESGIAVGRSLLRFLENAMF